MKDGMEVVIIIYDFYSSTAVSLLSGSIACTAMF
jgi:hypothetical protein